MLGIAQQAAVAQAVVSQSEALVSPPAATAPAAVAPAQSAAATAPQVVAPAVDPSGPTVAASRAGIAPKSADDTHQMAMMDQHMGEGQNIALMVVGGAALITGLLIGGGAGAAVAIGGAAIGLLGLYGYVK